ncbi:MAG TPA: PIN domain-containing protein [Verrucomicrobiae bacterium]|jgi:predicted nucleic acid-binding protein|nr:PIN domain-containing protein [Verrucomicrobiae bacterium]
MKVFCDTNVLVAAFVGNHPHHQAARPILERIKSRADQGFIAAHSLAESYAVLTRLPGASQVPPPIAWQLLSENLIQDFTLVSLSAKEYSTTIEAATKFNVQGGKIYDALLLAAAAKSNAQRIYTFNLSHFQTIASPNLRARIVSP